MSRLNIISKISSATVIILALYMTAPAGAAQDRTLSQNAEIRLDTPSGLPVPRLVSLKAQKTFCRSGPSFAHPVRLTFMRQGLPVLIIAETKDYWRKIRDLEGDECWTHKSKLSGIETALVLEDGLALRARPDASAPARARLGRGVITKVEDERDGWLRVTANGRKGWARASAFWGSRAQMPLGSRYSSTEALNIAATHN